jgi:hypothetical protein
VNGPGPAERGPASVSADGAELAAAEGWFVRHGLPYFVAAEREAVRRGLGRGRLVPMVGVALVVGAAAGVGVGIVTGSVSAGLSVGLLVAGAVLAGYAGTTLRVRPIARWAGAHTFRSLGLLFPLATRALPLLLLFVTFLFINTEVWMVASSLGAGVLTMALMFFVLVATGFLLVRLPEELDRVDDEIQGDRLVAACAGTPLEGAAGRVVDGVDHARHVEVTGYEKANLILVLLVSQLVQVLLLSVAVCLFFLEFGTVVMQEPVVQSWLGHAPDTLFGGLTVELVKVSVFLAGFSGLYFTVYAVTDTTYREQFFSSIVDELERAVAVRAVYQAATR